MTPQPHEENKTKLIDLIVGDLCSLRTPADVVLHTIAGGTCECCIYLGRKDKYQGGRLYENSYVFHNVLENREAFLCENDAIYGFYAVKI
jgi:hypothetical protein